jgi:hypothetical protein
MTKTPKRPRDANQLAKFVIDMATGEEAAPTPDPPKVARAKKAGAVGGPARARALTPERKKEIAFKAASARWKKGQAVE